MELMAGAQGVMMGTRFVASVESNAHDAYKSALVAAGPDDQAYTNCFDLGWPYGMHGVLRNSTFGPGKLQDVPQRQTAPARVTSFSDMEQRNCHDTRILLRQRALKEM